MTLADELVAVYNAAGQPVGSAPRSRVLSMNVWHATAPVLLRSGDGERVYVHRRTDTKEWFPGMHDCCAGGVIAAGESPIDCARRELAEELGVRGVALRPLFTMAYDVRPFRSHCFAFEATWDGPIVHQPEEVADGWWMSLDELRTRLADPGWPFVPDGRVLMTEWFRRRDAGELH